MIKDKQAFTYSEPEKKAAGTGRCFLGGRVVELITQGALLNSADETAQLKLSSISLSTIMCH